MTVAERVLEICKESYNGNMSKFARATGVTPAYISKLKNNPEAEPSEMFLKEVARNCNVNYTWLKTGTGDKRSDEGDAQAIIDAVMTSSNERVKKALVKLASMPEDYWEVLLDIVERLSEE